VRCRPGGPALPRRVSPGESPDRQIAARVLAGDERAFATWVVAHHPTLVRVARAFVRDEAAAEDVAQEVWIIALRNLAGFEWRSSLRTWLIGIAVNRARTRGARDGREVTFDEPETANLDPSRFDERGHWARPGGAWAARTPEEIVSTAETTAVIQSAIAALPERQRVVVELRDVAGLDGPEVAEMLGISEVHQRVLLHRGRTALREALGAHLGALR
jgi:RNA polymerase sigma-70 factor, ECF subfamily